MSACGSSGLMPLRPVTPIGLPDCLLPLEPNGRPWCLDLRLTPFHLAKCQIVDGRQWPIYPFGRADRVGRNSKWSAETLRSQQADPVSEEFPFCARHRIN